RKRVRAKPTQINAPLLPPGVRLVPFYDRADLVGHTVRTVEENLAFGAILVTLVLVVFLGDWRSAVIVGAVIPLSLLGAFILMDAEGVSANLISLGAVDFGIIVDAAVVMVEAFLVRLALTPPAGDVAQRHLLAEVAERMGRPIVFSKLIIITAFLPIFTFQRVEKRIFSPMAFTLSFALLGSLVLSLTLVPVLASMWLRGQRVEQRTPAARWLERVYRPCLEWVLDRPRITLGIAAAALVLALAAGTRLGTEFLPELDEGNIWLTVTLPVGISLERAKDIERQIRHTVLGHPQVRQVTTQLGRPDDGTDAKGANNLEVYADLKSHREWGSVRDKDELTARLYAELATIPGIDLNFSQYIKDNVEEALSGVKGELVVKIFGPDLDVLQEKAEETRRAMAGVRGVADLGVEQQFGQPQLRFQIDRAAAARYGLTVRDVDDAIETAIGGRAVTQLLDGSRVFDVRVRYAAACYGASRGDRADQHRVDLHPAVLGFRLDQVRELDPRQPAVRPDRRHRRIVGATPQPERVGRRGVHRPVRDLRAERCAAGGRVQPGARGGCSAGGGGAARGHGAPAPGRHGRAHGRGGAASGGC